MSRYSVSFTHKAKSDIDEAVAWYELQQAGLGSKFAKNLVSAVENIIRNLLGYAVKHNNTREKLIAKFPFVIVFEPEGMKIIIYRVSNCRQNPAKKTLSS